MANFSSLLICGWAFASVTPPCVAHRVWPMPVVPGDFLGGGALDQALDAAGLLGDVEAAVVQDRDASGVIAAIFETFQALKNDGRCFLFSDISDDSAHN